MSGGGRIGHRGDRRRLAEGTPDPSVNLVPRRDLFLHVGEALIVGLESAPPIAQVFVKGGDLVALAGEHAVVTRGDAAAHGDEGEKRQTRVHRTCSEMKSDEATVATGHEHREAAPLRHESTRGKSGASPGAR